MSDLCRINYYKEGDILYPKFDAVEAYRKAIKTWGKWIDNNVNPRKQIVYYRGYSSAHFRYRCFLDFLFLWHKNLCSLLSPVYLY